MSSTQKAERNGGYRCKDTKTRSEYIMPLPAKKVKKTPAPEPTLELGADAPEWAKRLFGRLGNVLDALEGDNDDDAGTNTEAGASKENGSGERKPTTKHWLLG